MLFLTVLVIALGWAGWLWAWGRDRYVSGSSLGVPNPFAHAPVSRLAAPHDQVGARQRRREVLGTLVVTTLLSFLIARAWAPMWVVAAMSFFALLGYGWAFYQLENGGAGTAIGSLQQRFGPVPETGPAPEIGPAPEAGPARQLQTTDHYDRSA